MWERIVATFAGAVAHWFLQAWADQKIEKPELLSIPSIVIMVACVVVAGFNVAGLFDDIPTAFVTGYFVDSVFKNLFRARE